jgi:eukaryotic-like serine/threonine-protein kinase
MESECHSSAGGCAIFRPDGQTATVDVRQTLGGRYKLLNELGSGGMAVVWRARDEVLGRPVAVKLLASRYSGDPQSRARIRSEARAAANLSHPNIAQVYDYGEADEGGVPRPYVVMELVNGPTLQQRMASGPLPPRTVFRICGEVAAALAAAHAEGLVHRDIKMANIMVTTAGAKVVDFGIAAAVGPVAPEEMLVGTPAYLAPERLTGDAVLAASDVYALGVLLYRLLADESPWSVESTTQMLKAHVYLEPTPLPPTPGVPPAVAALITRCLRKNPQARPTASTVSSILADAAEALPEVRGADAAAAHEEAEWAVAATLTGMAPDGLGAETLVAGRAGRPAEAGAAAQAATSASGRPAAAAAKPGMTDSDPQSSARATASDRGPGAAAPDHDARLSASDRGPGVAGSEREARLSASDRGAGVAGPERDARLSASDRGPGVAGPERDARPSASDRDGRVAVSESHVRVTPEGDARMTRPDHDFRVTGSERGPKKPRPETGAAKAGPRSGAPATGRGGRAATIAPVQPDPRRGVRRAGGVRLGKRKSLLAAGIATVTAAALIAWLLIGDREAEDRGAATGIATSPAPVVDGGLGTPPPSSGAEATASAATALPGPGPIAGNDPLKSADPADSTAASRGATKAPPGPTGSPSASPSPATPPPGKRLTSPGGAVYATCADGKATLTGSEPADGYTVEQVEPGPALTPRIIFKGPKNRYRITVTCVAGTPTPVVLPL